MKKEIRYFTSHFDSSPSKWMDWLSLDDSLFDLVYDPVSPQYLIATEQLYTERRLKNNFKKVYRPDSQDQLIIFYADECVFPDMNLFDYAVCYDRRLSFEDRIIRRPMPSIFAGFTKTRLDVGCADAGEELKAKTSFCNFIYSNPAAHPRRDQIFYALSSYKRVDALGPHLNNCGVPNTRAAKNFQEICVRLKSPYKFSISCENAAYNGYVSEKLITSWLARSVPIYWGDPTCAEEYNPNAFICVNGMSDEQLIKAVRDVDDSDELWKKIVSEPLLTQAQYEKWQADDKAYREFMNNLFLEPVQKVKRLQRGFWPDNCRRQFMMTNAMHFSRHKRILAALGRETEFGDWLFTTAKKLPHLV